MVVHLVSRHTGRPRDVDRLESLRVIPLGKELWERLGTEDYEPPISRDRLQNQLISLTRPGFEPRLAGTFSGFPASSVRRPPRSNTLERDRPDFLTAAAPALRFTIPPATKDEP